MSNPEATQKRGQAGQQAQARCYNMPNNAPDGHYWSWTNNPHSIPNHYKHCMTCGRINATEWLNTEVCKALDSIELPNAEILTTKYGHNSTEKKYGYSVAMFEANDAIAKVKAEYEVKE